MKKTALLAVAALLAPTMLSTGVSAATTDTPVTANFTVSSTDNNNPTPPNPVDPSNPDNNNTSNKPLNPNGTFGLAYIPNQFNFGDIDLTNQSSITKPITLSSGKTLNVGVKDTTHSRNGWTLNASLVGDLANYGATISTTTSAAQVNSNGSLSALPDTNMITVTKNATISSNSSLIMQGNNGVVFSGTYDLDLGTVSLNIPDVSNVPSGVSTANVNWDLAQTPQP